MESKQSVGVDSEIGSVEKPEDDSFPSEEISGCKNPKIIEREEMQQKLARLCSFSSALTRANERNDSLSKQLQSINKVRQKYLQQSNELNDMRRKLMERKLAMGEMAMQMRETKEDVKCKIKEQLGAALESWLVAGKKLCAANQLLQEANKLVIGKMGLGNAKSLRMLRMRQQHMITQVNSLYPVKSLKDNASKEKFDRSCGGDQQQSSLPDMSRSPPLTSLTILDQQLAALPLKKTSFFSNKKEMQRSSIVLGYVAHVVVLIASYLDVPLRYPLHLGGSRSHIFDYALSTESSTSD